MIKIMYIDLCSWIMNHEQKPCKYIFFLLVSVPLFGSNALRAPPRRLRLVLALYTEKFVFYKVQSLYELFLNSLFTDKRRSTYSVALLRCLALLRFYHCTQPEQKWATLLLSRLGLPPITIVTALMINQKMHIASNKITGAEEEL